ncbi:MAG TPA: ribonuclease III [Candidatus Saccharimonadales bacterium]|nr:ribonuclease III [Candidatus Saccharimonadales bacterium]
MKKLSPFKNQQLFEQAFTHRSFLNESKQKVESNERLEFLGDSILSFVVSKWLYQKYPEYHEGNLTNIRSLLVNTKTLAEVAKELSFGSYLKLSRGEEEAKGRENQSLLADSFEAYLGALFLDQGLKIVGEFIEKTVLPRLDEIIKKRDFKDPKSLFQEMMQAQTHASPLYKVTTEEGPSHAKIFTVAVYIKDVRMGEGKGRSKQEAEENAAKQALEKMGK